MGVRVVRWIKAVRILPRCLLSADADPPRWGVIERGGDGGVSQGGDVASGRQTRGVGAL
ncbi:hypothetical protein STXM2123_1471 [Streptomyces sp. F-3]|nr:hypothetical protein STXM2123_1471 [Streptomyces sp. F-3]